MITGQGSLPRAQLRTIHVSEASFWSVNVLWILTYQWRPDQVWRAVGPGGHPGRVCSPPPTAAGPS